MSATSIRVAGLCLIGLIVAVAIALLASNLVSEEIGLASEPLSATEALAPGDDPSGEDPRETTTTETTTTSEVPTTSTSTTTTSTAEDEFEDD